MYELKMHKDVPAKADRVWDVMTDMDTWTETINGIDRIERLDGGNGFDVGTRWRETRVMFKKEATEEMEVTAIDPGRSYTVEADSRGAHYKTVMAVEPINDSWSRLSMTFVGTPNSLVGRVAAATLGRLFRRATEKELRKDIDDIAAAAQRDTSSDR